MPGTRVDPGSTVELVVSTGPKPVATVDVPNVVGLTPLRCGLPDHRPRPLAVGRRTGHRHRTPGRPGDRPEPRRRHDGQCGNPHRARGRCLRELRGNRHHRHERHALMKVAVLSGGRSSEHEVSLNSGEAVAAGLTEAGHEVVSVIVGKDGRWLCDGEPVAVLPGAGLSAEGAAAERVDGVEVVFPALHGPFGEDGVTQGTLDTAGLPYAAPTFSARPWLHGQADPETALRDSRHRPGRFRPGDRRRARLGNGSRSELTCHSGSSLPGSARVSGSPGSTRPDALSAAVPRPRQSIPG